MRRLSLALAVLVGLIFIALAIPGSPLTAWLARSLGERVPPAEGATAAPAGRADEYPSSRQLRAAVGAMISPQWTSLAYRELFELLARRLDRQLVFVQRRTYGELNDMIVAGEVDVAWICTGALTDLGSRQGALLAAVPVVDGLTTYRSYLVVPEGSNAQSPADLRGKVFAYTDELSLTGRRVIEDWLEQRGLTSREFFASVFFTHAHDKSIRAVARRLADGACVDSLVYDFLAEHSPQGVRGTKVVWHSESFPIPPIVVPARVDAAFRNEIVEALLELSDDAEAAETLEGIGVESFVAGDPGLYFRP